MEKTNTTGAAGNGTPDKDNVSGSKTTKDARTAAANDISKDPDTHVQPSVDGLDEAELAKKDNSND